MGVEQRFPGHGQDLLFKPVRSLVMPITRDSAAMERRRKTAGRLFGKDMSATDVARRLGVSRQVAYRWKKSWEQGGEPALASKGPPGRRSRLTAAQTRRITRALIAGPTGPGCRSGDWTLPRVAKLIEDLTGVHYHPGHIWRWLRASGFTLHRTARPRFNQI
jgi:hypothetical protein